MFLFWKKNVETFLEYFSYAFSPAVGAKFVLEQKVRNNYFSQLSGFEYQYLQYKRF